MFKPQHDANYVHVWRSVPCHIVYNLKNNILNKWTILVWQAINTTESEYPVHWSTMRNFKICPTLNLPYLKFVLP